MKNRGLELFSAILDFTNLLLFIFSLQLQLKGIVSGLSLLAILTFSSIWFIEHLRKQAIDNINMEKPQLDHTDVMMRNSRLQALRSHVEAKIKDWEQEQQQRVQEKNEEYFGRERIVFGIGVFITVVITCLLIFS